MKTLFIALTLLFSSYQLKADTLSCKISHEAIDSIDKSLLYSFADNFNSINLPEKFDLKTSNEEMLLSYNIQDNVGVKGTDLEQYSNHDVFMQFGNYETSDHPWNNKHGTDIKSSLKIKKRKIKGVIFYEYFSLIAYMDKPIKKQYVVEFDQTDLKGKLKAKLKQSYWPYKTYKFELDFMCI